MTRLALVFLLLAGPLAGQAVLTVNDTTVVNVNLSGRDTLVLEFDITVAQASLDAGAAAIAPAPGPTRWQQAQGAAWLVLGTLALLELRKWVGKWEPSTVEQSNTNEDGDVSVEGHTHAPKSGKSDKH